FKAMAAPGETFLVRPAGQSRGAPRRTSSFAFRPLRHTAARQRTGAVTTIFDDRQIVLVVNDARLLVQPCSGRLTGAGDGARFDRGTGAGEPGFDEDAPRGLERHTRARIPTDAGEHDVATGDVGGCFGAAHDHAIPRRNCYFDDLRTRAGAARARLAAATARA